MLRAVKVWPGKGGAYGKVGATANLDSSCARRLCNIAGRGEETGFQIEQRNRSRKIAALKPLDKKDPIQGVEPAIRIARALGIPLKIAAKVDKEYFRVRIKPLLDGAGVEFVGENEAAKGEFLGEALALLFPIAWPEPFALVMIEAMACGTPVLAFRKGSVAESWRMTLLDGESPVWKKPFSRCRR